MNAQRAQPPSTLQIRTTCRIAVGPDRAHAATMKIPVVTVFGSSAPKPGSPAYIAAFELGRRIAENGWQVCNGGYGGTMEAAARGAATAGGVTIGVVCSGLGPFRPNRYIRKCIRTRTLFDRLKTLIRTGRAYVVLPGGTGTLVELALVLEHYNKNMFPSHRPLILLGEDWLPVVECSTRERPLPLQPVVCYNPEEAVERLLAHFGPRAEKKPRRGRSAAGS